MSLVPTYVKCSDGKWYKDPVLSDEANDWFICFDDDDPPELVMKMTGNPIQMRREKAVALLKQLGINATAGPMHSAGRVFPIRVNPSISQVHTAASFFLRLSGAPPSRLVVSHHGVFDTRPKGEGVFYDLG